MMKTKAFDKIKTNFQFLISEYDFQLTKTEIREDFIAKHFLVYRNDRLQIQLEICGDDSPLHCEMRRLINEEPAKYSDRNNCIDFESPATLKSFLEKHRNSPITDIWADVKRIKQLKDDEFQKKFGFL